MARVSKGRHNMMKITKIIYYHTVMLLRDKQNMIMLIFFPVLIFILLGKSFYENIEYDHSLNLALYLLPGLVVMSILNTCVFSIGQELSVLSDKDILSRLFLTPIKKSRFLGAYVFSRMILIAIVLLLLFITAWLLFNVKLIAVDFGSFCAAAILCIIVCTELGFLAFGAANSSNSVVAICNLLTMPMLFVSGTFFPLDKNPFLYHLSLIMPIEPSIKIFQGILLKQMNLFSLGGSFIKQIIIAIGLGLIDIYILTKRKKI